MEQGFAGWKKWDPFITAFLRPIGEAIIERLEIKEDDIVLDVTAVIGEPGLTIAAIAKKGKVTGTDLSEDMLAIGQANAFKKRLKYCISKSPMVASCFLMTIYLPKSAAGWALSFSGYAICC